MGENSKENTKGEKRSLYSRLGFKGRNTLWGVIFLLPWLFGAIFFFIVPLVKTFYYSICNINIVGTGFTFQYIGLENFKYATGVDPDFNKKLIEALTNMARDVPIQIFIALFIAILLNAKFKGRGFFRVIFFIPLILSTGVTEINLSEVVAYTEETTSIINTAWLTGLIANSGIPNSILSTLTSVINDIFNVITTAGVQILIFLSGLQAISPTLYEVAKIEGCTGFESFCKITFPMISPMILVCVVYSMADSFAIAEISDTIYKTTFTSGKYGLGASMSVIYFLVSMAAIGIVSWIISKGVFYYDN